MRSVIRWIRAVLLAGVAGGLAVVVGAMPVGACGGGRPVLDFRLTASAVPAGVHRLDDGKHAGFWLANRGNTTITGVTGTVETAGLGGKLCVAPGYGYPCPGSGAAFTIALGDVPAHAAVQTYRLLMAVAPGTPVGARGTVAVTVAAPGVAPVRRVFRLSVAGSGPDLVAWSMSPRPVWPGERFVVFPVISNLGDTAGTITATARYPSRYVSLDQQYAPNCHPDLRHGYVAVCTYPGSYRTGGWMELPAPPVALRVSPNAPVGTVLPGGYAVRAGRDADPADNGAPLSLPVVAGPSAA
jgi:hypothetical protein